MDQEPGLSESARLFLLVSLLAQERLISNNAKAFLKEMVLRRDPRLVALLAKFESKDKIDYAFLEQAHDIIENEAQSAFNELFCDTPLEVGKTISKSEREQRQLNEEKSLIYGEVEFKSFYRILRKINPKPNLTFYDLGSGTGKAVFAARLTQDFAKCIGIEILQGLHNQAFKITSRYNTQFRNLLCSTQRQHAAVYKGSFVEYDWTDGDVVFANSTCFDEDLMLALSKKAEQLKPGSIVVTFTRGLSPSTCYELLESKRERMSWGPATVYIHRRLNLDGSSSGGKELNTLPCDDVECEMDYDLDSSDSSPEEFYRNYRREKYGTSDYDTDSSNDDSAGDDKRYDNDDYDNGNYDNRNYDDRNYDNDKYDDDRDSDDDSYSSDHVPYRARHAVNHGDDDDSSEDAPTPDSESGDGYYERDGYAKDRYVPELPPGAEMQGSVYGATSSPRRPTSGLSQAGLNSPQDSALMHRKQLRALA